MIGQIDLSNLLQHGDLVLGVVLTAFVMVYSNKKCSAALDSRLEQIKTIVISNDALLKLVSSRIDKIEGKIHVLTERVGFLEGRNFSTSDD